MKHLLLFCLLSPALLCAQQYYAVDERSLNTPNSRTRSIARLADHLAEDTNTDLEKLRAVYGWITRNIRYEDTYSASDFWATPEYLEEQSPENVLRNRSAVCQGYANLFRALSAELGIPCEVVTGIVKESDGGVPRLGHAWVAARADGKWYHFDPTWGVPASGSSAYTVNDRYFAPAPERFILNHLPDDPMWQLLEKPVDEQTFRRSANAEIAAYLVDPPEKKFSYTDTLDQWLAMGAAQRMLRMEDRVLEFNGSNERAVFSLGQNYWALFYDQHRLLDSLADDSILQDSVTLDTSWFLAQTQLMERYHSRARELLNRIETRERLAHVQKFYTPGDVAAIIYKLKGSLWTGQFENAFRQTAEFPKVSHLPELRAWIKKADAEYAAAERTLNCDKTYNTCLEIWHNRSLGYIQMGQREVQIIEELLSEKDTRRTLEIVETLVPEARFYFLQATEEVRKMTLRPPVFAFTRDRQKSILEGLWTVRACEIRAGRVEVMPVLEDVLRNASFSLPKAETVLRDLVGIQSSLYEFIDSVENSSAGMHPDFIQNLLFNLNYETFSLQYNLGTLRYKKAWFQWEQARKNNKMTVERENIRFVAHQVAKAAKEADAALSAVARSGQLSGSNLNQKRQMVNKLREAAEGLLNALR